MRILIAEDDLASRKFLQKFLSQFGECDLVVDGEEAVEAFMIAWDEGQPYELICLDIMMPNLDGLKALKVIRDIEKEKPAAPGDRAKIVMITALDEIDKVTAAFEIGCEGYAAKPVDTGKFLEVLVKLNLVDGGK
ncbi:MAG TPA: response regulator [Selenomonadales bacterium]|nr:response regulator [Selenomonadales bacterium]